MPQTYGPERHHQLVEALIGEHEWLYRTSASFKAKIETYARMLAQIIEDAAAAAVAEGAELEDLKAKIEKRTPAFMVRGDIIRPICGEQSPALVIEGNRHEVCQLEPLHRGPHQGGSDFYAGGDAMTWTTP